MSQLNALLSDLRDRKLWPLALVLLAAVVAVPVLLSSNKPAPPAQPLPSLATRVEASVPTVTVNGTPTQAPLTGSAHDPFVQQPLPTPKTSTGAASSAAASVAGAVASAVSAASGHGSSATTGTTSGTTSSGTTSPVVSPVPPVSPPKTHAPAPGGLTSTRAYHVSLEITNASGGVQPIDPMKRDTELPSASQPLLIDLGVLQGGKHVIFAVEPGAVVSGPGTCIPGPVDCELLALRPGQTESVSQAGSGHRATLFQVTDISVDQFATAAQASKARAAVDSAGRTLLARSTSSTLTLFQYDPALDAIVDLRNLTVGGN